MIIPIQILKKPLNLSVGDKLKLQTIILGGNRIVNVTMRNTVIGIISKKCLMNSKLIISEKMCCYVFAIFKNYFLVELDKPQ